jgi:hypothetical protein
MKLQNPITILEDGGDVTYTDVAIYINISSFPVPPPGAMGDVASVTVNPYRFEEDKVVFSPNGTRYLVFAIDQNSPTELLEAAMAIRTAIQGVLALSGVS